MSINFFNAFTFMFKEKNWFVKFLIGALLFFFIKLIALAMDIIHTDTLPTLNFNLFNENSPVMLIALYTGALLLLVLSIWMHATSLGYIITTIRRYMRGEEDIIPDWDDVMGKLFRRGFKAFIAIFIYISAISIFATGAYTFATLALIFSPFATMLIFLVASFVIVYSLLLIPALLLSYCEKDRFLAAFNFVRARQIMLKSIGKYVLALIMLLAVIIFSAIISITLFQAKIGILILPVLCFYLFIVKGNILAQYYVATHDTAAN